MKITSSVSLLVALTVISSHLAMAQGFDRQRDYGGDRRYQEQPGPDRREMYPPPRRDMYRHDGYARRYEYDQSMDPRWPGPDREYRRGDRLPYEYRQNSYVVEDWRSHNLNTPPRGYRWVQSGADYLLVAVTTGLILDILINH